MIIDRVYQLCLYISNKEQRGDIPPSKFNLLAEMAQLEYISKRVGNIKILNERGVPQFGYGYESNWRIHEDLRPMVTQPEVIPLLPNGNFFYPYGYIWPDAVHKNDYTPIKRITADQYPHIKRSLIKPPTEAYPVMIMRGGQYGFVDPYSIGSFTMSYLKTPPLPVWGHGPLVNDRPVFDANLSVDLSVPPMAYLEIALMILSHIGINLSDAQITQYSMAKQSEGV